jgi:hypothetical protein
MWLRRTDFAEHTLRPALRAADAAIRAALRDDKDAAMKAALAAIVFPYVPE